MGILSNGRNEDRQDKNVLYVKIWTKDLVYLMEMTFLLFQNMEH